MKHTRIWMFALAMIISMGVADAQVSVRRTARSSSEQTSTKKEKKEGKTSANAPAKNKDAANAPSAKNNAPTVSKQKPSAKKNTPQTTVADGKTLRQQAFDDYQKDNAEETPWQHIVYREIDLTKDVNASLYFPIEPMDGMTNLFRVIIEAFSKGDLRAYEYLDGREVFTKEYRVKPNEIFDKYDIYYKAVPPTQRGGDTTYVVEESNVPSSQVLKYYVKERWEFDQKHSKYQARILCICPVLFQGGDFSDNAVPYPLFWINYEDLRPFLRDHLVVSSGMNTAARFTMEEFFSLGQYQGDIYKEQNLRGLSLKQQVGDNPDSLRAVQTKLDNDLRTFEDSIWVKDPAPSANEKKSRKDRLQERIEAKVEALENADGDIEPKVNRRTKEQVDMEAAAEEKFQKATTRKSVRRNRN
ncbi:MAG: gliding motility protein GldN [Bacteroidales bacterium]|nr:gliding motility protein GldN [Bacteroidales bacterium]